MLAAGISLSRYVRFDKAHKQPSLLLLARASTAGPSRRLSSRRTRGTDSRMIGTFARTKPSLNKKSSFRRYRSPEVASPDAKILADRVHALARWKWELVARGSSRALLWQSKLACLVSSNKACAGSGSDSWLSQHSRICRGIAAKPSA